MSKHLIFQGLWWQASCLLVAVIMLTGCQGSPRISDEQKVVRYQHFREQLILSTQAINASDLEGAKTYLSKAGKTAATPREHRKIRSLERLIAGTEALRAGDPDGARAEWSRIEEPRLNREVRYKARLIGMDVPRVSLEGEATR